jgi:hypothetical protein
MRGFVPKDIFVMSKEELAAAGLSRAVVSRVWSKKCLWLIRMSDEAIMEVNVPNGIPLVYELDDNLQPIQHFYLD